MRCPVCGIEGARSRRLDEAGVMEYSCPNCAEFRASGLAPRFELSNLASSERAALSIELNEAARAGQPVLLTTGTAARILRAGWKAADTRE